MRDARARHALGWAGAIRVETFRDGLLVAQIDLRNLVVDAGLDLIADALNGNRVVADSAISYLALGDDNSAVSAGDLSLGNERFRKRVTKQSDAGTGALDTVTTVTPDEANFDIEEIGWFGGSATATPNSGTMIARVLFSQTKTAGESLQITRTDTFTAA